MHPNRSKKRKRKSDFSKPNEVHNSPNVTNPTQTPLWAQSQPLQKQSLQINQPDDPYEQQAENIANQVMRMPESTVQPADAKPLQRTATSQSASHTAPQSVNHTINQGGQPLDHNTQQFMESRFGRDFSDVRIHTDSQAMQSATEVNARAYTVGNHIIFGSGAYQPTGAEGNRLIAHELTHVVQQQSMTPRIQRQEESSLLQLSPDQAELLGSFTFSGFALNSSDLTTAHRDHMPTYIAVLQSLFRQYPGSRLTLVGHTDASGDQGHNEILGQLRADTVMLQLILGGIPASAMSTSSMGETDLAIPTQERESLNRRVVAHFIPYVPEASIPSPDAEPDSTPPPIDLFPDNLFPRYIPPLDDPNQLPPWMWDPNFPRRLERPTITFNSVLDNAINGILDPILDPLDLPDWVEERIRGGARSLVDKGLETALDSALDAGNIHGEAREAITTSIEALRQQSISP